MMKSLLLAAVLLLPSAAVAQSAADPTGYASAADVKAQVESMRRTMKPGQGFMWQPLVRGGDAVAALEYWKKPAKPAVHPDQAEYVIVVAGNGTMVSGGRLMDPVTTNPTLIEGSRIEGGRTRALHTGDVFVIPAGTPHWFGITGDRRCCSGPRSRRRRIDGTYATLTSLSTHCGHYSEVYTSNMLSLVLLSLAAAAAQSDHPKTYLLSIGGIAVPRDEMIEAFAFSTWGVTFKSVCHIAPGWTIKAGGSLTPEGTFEGYGSLGVSMPRSANPTSFRSLALVELYAPVQQRDIRFPKNSGEIPATFKGHARVSDGDTERKVPLTYRNVRLVPARSCPPS